MNTLHDTATQAWWGFVDNTELVEALHRQAEWLARRAHAQDADDLFQIACLWLSVRPHLHDLDVALILRHTREPMTRTTAQTQYRSTLEVPSEVLTDVFE